MPTAKNWVEVKGDAEAEVGLRDALGIHPITAKLLARRGIVTPEAAERFLDPSLDRLHPVDLLPDVGRACERLKSALAANEKILIHGDFDGDGVTSSALWKRTLDLLGGSVEVFLPHRGRDGHDMRAPIVEQAKRDGVKLIVTTDCGIQRVDEVEQAREYGIDVIITDHHSPPVDGSLPKAVAVVNPHRHDSKYPFRELAGVGVAFKVCEALVQRLGHKVDGFRRSCLDLVAIGTVTDVMPLLDENRILVSNGLNVLHGSKKPGLRALMSSAGMSPERPPTAYDIGFKIGPRLNSASRIDDARVAFDLLVTRDVGQANELAAGLEAMNTERRAYQSGIFEQVMEQVARQDLEEARCLVIHGEGWRAGIVGLVASRLANQFHRPCVVISVGADGNARGSARSIPSFNVFNAIDSCKGMLTEYGGHAFAAGVQMPNANLDGFGDEMRRLAAMQLAPEDCVPGLDYDVEVAPGEMTAQLMCELERLAPFGNANAQPLFVSRGVRVNKLETLSQGKHLKFWLNADGLNGDDQVPGLWWQMGSHYEALSSAGTLDVCFRPEFNHFNGRRSIQFVIEDIRPPEW